MMLTKLSRQWTIVTRMNIKSAFEYIRSLMNINNPLRHLLISITNSMIPTKAPSDFPVKNYETLTMGLRKALTTIYSR